MITNVSPRGIWVGGMNCDRVCTGGCGDEILRGKLRGIQWGAAILWTVDPVDGAPTCEVRVSEQREFSVLANHTGAWSAHRRAP